MSAKSLKPYLDENRGRLTADIRSGSYYPQPIRGKEIPKRNGKKRLLGIPTVVDRMLHQATARILQNKYDFMFSSYSYGFRPHRNQHQAIGRALSYINAGYQYIVDIDLQGFFDEVDHSILLQILYRKVKCKVTLQLIRRWLRAPLLQDGKLTKRRKGVPQGSPLSPLLSNILLNELDVYMESKGLRFVRFADDFSIYCRTKQEARKVGNAVYLFLKHKLKLPINRDKSGVRRPVDFNILGYGFVPTYIKGEKGKYQLVIDKSRWVTFKQRIKEITRKTKPMSLIQRIKELKEFYCGWLNYAKFASIICKLKKLDGWIRNRLRYCIWHDWKKPERKRKNLILLGVCHGDAYAWSRTRKGGWAIAQSPILGTTITLEYLRKQGYKSLLEHYTKARPIYEKSLFPSV